jgi:hypothetical protein
MWAAPAVLRLADFRRDAWTDSDALWEELQLAAVERLLAGDRATPAALLARALALAEQGFARDDPRLAASLTNLARLRQEVAGEAEDAFARAIRLWGEAEAWLERLRVGDDALSPPQCRRLLAEGHRHAVALASRRPILIPCGLVRWRARRDPGRPDRRKLLAAVFLSTFRRPSVAGPG